MFTLPVVWLAGGAAGHLSGVALLPAGFTSVSLRTLGFLTAAGLNLAPRAVTALAGVLGIVHGWLNGAALAVVGREASGLVGITGGIFLLAALVAAGVISLRHSWARIAVRVAGSWIAAIGLLLLGWALSGRG